MDDSVKHAAVVTALNDMVRRGSFSICTLDKCADILGVQVRGSEAYTLLSALHCVDFAAMPSNLKQAIPELIRECLNLESIGEFASITAETPRKTLFGRLLN
jgi:hypothetical protein